MASHDTDTLPGDTQSVAQLRADVIEGTLSGAANLFSPVVFENPNIIPLVGISVSASEKIRRGLDPVLGNPAPINEETQLPEYPEGYKTPSRLSAAVLWNLNSIFEGKPTRIPSVSTGERHSYTFNGNINGSGGPITYGMTQSGVAAMEENGAITVGFSNTIVPPGNMALGHVSGRVSLDPVTGTGVAAMQFAVSINLSRFTAESIDRLSKRGGALGAFADVAAKAIRLTSEYVGNVYFRFGFQTNVQVSANGEYLLTDDQQALLKQLDDFMKPAEDAMAQLPELPEMGTSFYTPDGEIDQTTMLANMFLNLTGGNTTLPAGAEIQQGLADLAELPQRLLAGDAPIKTTIPEVGVVTTDPNSSNVWFDGYNETSAVLADGNLWVFYPNGSIYIRDAEGTVYLYSKKYTYDGGVEYAFSTMDGSNVADVTKEVREYLEGGYEGTQAPGGDLEDAPLPDILEKFYFSLHGILLTSAEPGFIPDLSSGAGTGETIVLMPNGLPARIDTVNGEAVSISYPGGDTVALPDREARLALAHTLDNNGADDAALQQLTEYAGIQFTLWKQAQSIQRGVDTWETQYKPIADQLIEEILYSRPEILTQFPKIQNLIDAYRAGEGAYRFIGGLAYLMTGDSVGDTVPEEFIANLTTDQVNRTVEGLMDALNYDLSLTDSDALGSARGKAFAALNAFQLVRKAQATFSADGTTVERLGYASDAVTALGSLSALGLVDEEFARGVALGYLGTAAFLAVQDALKDGPASEGYGEAVGAAVAVIGTLGKLGVIDESTANAIEGAYAAYTVVETGVDIYENWGNTTAAQDFKAVGAVLTALAVFGRVGWLSEEDAENIKTATEAFNVIRTGYLAATDVSNLNTTNFAVAFASLVVPDDNLEAQFVLNVVAMFAYAAQGNFLGAGLSFLSAVSFNKARREQRAAEREARRDQIINIADDVDVDGDGVSLDGVHYEWNNTDNYIYQLGDPEAVMTSTSYRLVKVEFDVIRLGNGDYVKESSLSRLPDRYVLSGARDPEATSYVLDPTKFESIEETGIVWADGDGDAPTIYRYRVTAYEMQISRGFDQDALGPYANSDMRVVRDQSDWQGPNWLRNELALRRSDLATDTLISAADYQEFTDVYGKSDTFRTIDANDSPVGSRNGNELADVNALAPIPDGVAVAYVQEDENLGLTIFRQMNDDNGDGRVDATDILDRVTTFASIGGQTRGDDSTLVQLLNKDGEVYQAYALSQEATSNAPPPTSLQALGDTRPAKQRIDPLELGLGLSVENRVENLGSVKNSLREMADNGAGSYLHVGGGGLVFVFDGTYFSAYDATGLVGKSTTILAEIPSGPGPGVEFYYPDPKGFWHEMIEMWAIDIAKDYTPERIDINLAETGETTIAGRALQTLPEFNLENFGNLEAQNEISIDLGSRASAVATYQALTTSSGGESVQNWFSSEDGRFVATYTTNLPSSDWRHDTLLVYNSAGRLLGGLDLKEFGTNELPPILGSGGVQLIQAGIIREAIQEVTNIQNGTSPDITPLGLDVTGLNPGVMTFNGNEVFGFKDFTKAPISESEILIYVSWLASKLVDNPDFWQEIGQDALSSDPEVAARAARIYVSENTPREEFWGNNERPSNVSFDARAYLVANPDIVVSFAADSDIGYDAVALMGRINSGALIEPDADAGIEGDIPKILDLFQRAALQFVDRGRTEGRLYAAYETDLNGDRQIDIVRVTDEGLVTATILGGSDAQGNPLVTDYVVQDGKFLGLRRDIDGDGIADTIAAPDVDGGIWNVTLSSNGNTASGRTADAAQYLALANTDLLPGADGIWVDVNNDGTNDLARILADGTAQITLGVKDETADGGIALSDKVYTGETMQDAVADANALHLLAWVAGNTELLLGVGSDRLMAQVAFGRVGNLNNSLNMGQFALDNQDLIETNGGDMVAALSSYIDTQRADLISDLQVENVKTEGQISFLEESAAYKNLGIFLAGGDRDAQGSSIAPHTWMLTGSWRLEYSDTFQTALEEYQTARRTLLDSAEALTPSAGAPYFKLFDDFNDTTTGPIVELYTAYRTELNRLSLLLNDKLDGMAAGDLNFTFDANMLIGDRVMSLTDSIAEDIRANNPTPAAPIALGDAVESAELEGALLTTQGFEVGTAVRDIFTGNLTEQNRYAGLTGNDSIAGGNLRDELLGGAGHDDMLGLHGNDVLDGGAGNDLINGGIGNDVVFGRTGEDVLRGSSGNDVLVGGAGDDVLFGHQDDDVLVGGEGTDTLTGGTGADRFIYTDSSEIDVVTDFNSAQGDKVLLDVSGIDDFAAAMAVAYQNGSDTVFDFGPGQRLELQNVALGSLTADNFDFEFGKAALDALIALRSNQIPTVNITQSFTSPEDEAFSFTLSEQAFNDPDGDKLTMSAELAPGTDSQIWNNYLANGGTGLPDWLTFSAETLTFSGQPPQDFNGTIVVRVYAVDGFYAAHDTVTLEFTPVEDLLSAVTDTGYSMTVGTPVTISATELLANDQVGENGAISLVSVQNAADGVVSLDDDGNVVFNARPTFRGETTFEYTVEDGAGVTSTATVTVQVNGAVATSGDDFLTGTDGNDTIEGLAGVDKIHGYGGDDTLSGGDDTDQIWGGDGNDVLSGGRNLDYLHGGDGNDLLDGGSGRDALFGGEGNDILRGGDGDDFWIAGEEGDDALFGGAGDDRLAGGAGANTLDGGTGDDMAIFFGARADYQVTYFEETATYTITEIANPSNVSTLVNIETVTFDDGTFAIETLANSAPVARNDIGLSTQLGSQLTISAAELLSNDSDPDGDTLTIISVSSGQGGSVTLNDAGDVVFTADRGFAPMGWFEYTISDGQGGTATARANVQVTPRIVSSEPTAGDDVLLGGPGNDNINALAGNDTVFGLDGNDILRGGAGNDVLNGGAGNDQLYGDAGDDVLNGGAGDDYFRDFSGNNIIDGGAGEDVMAFTLGRVYYDTARNEDGSITVSRGSFSVTLSNVETVTFRGTSYAFEDLAPTLLDGVLSGSGVDNYITGGAADEIISGLGGRDTLRGGAGNDTLLGGDGNDILRGDTGNDVLDGGAGNDQLYGGSGDDVLNGGAGDDYFRDFSGNNIIDGGAGEDVMAFTLGRVYYDIVRNDDGSVTVSRGGFSATLYNVETATFAGVAYEIGDLAPPLIINGTDTAIYRGNLADYQVERTSDPNTYRITERANPENTGTLVNVENVVFDGMSYSIESLLHSAQAANNNRIGDPSTNRQNSALSV